MKPAIKCLANGEFTILKIIWQLSNPRLLLKSWKS